MQPSDPLACSSQRVVERARPEVVTDSLRLAYEAHYRPLLRPCVLVTGRRETAEDLPRGPGRSHPSARRSSRPRRGRPHARSASRTSTTTRSCRVAPSPTPPVPPRQASADSRPPLRGHTGSRERRRRRARGRRDRQLARAEAGGLTHLTGLSPQSSGRATGARARHPTEWTARATGARPGSRRTSRSGRPGSPLADRAGRRSRRSAAGRLGRQGGTRSTARAPAGRPGRDTVLPGHRQHGPSRRHDGEGGHRGKE